MSSDIAIEACGLSKHYRIFDHPIDRLRQLLIPGSKRLYREIPALHDISFRVRRGETMGIIGRNGSGKSTLLQLVCGILKPSGGEIRVAGRVSALLELGAGFHPEFSGRDNVYLQGAILGLSPDQMRERFADIAAFADIGDFIDQPVRTYSSGMFVRLAFSVAIHVDPDILIVDEALAVGDMAFQAKCMAAFSRFRGNGMTILFVSHDINTVKTLCDTAIYLDKGRLRQTGPASEVAEAYAREMRTAMQVGMPKVETAESPPQTAAPLDSVFREDADFTKRVEGFRQGSGEVRLVAVELLDETGLPLAEATFDQCVLCRLHLKFLSDCEVAVSYYIRDDKLLILAGSTTVLEGYGLVTGKAGERKIVEFFTKLPLMEGAYNLLAILSIPTVLNQSAHFVDYVENALVFRMSQRQPVKLWSKVYLNNSLTVSDV